jgi:hypothetical protein
LVFPRWSLVRKRRQAAGVTRTSALTIVEDDDRSIFIAGDASYTADRATVYLPSHDPGSAARLAERRVVPTREAKQAAGARA